MDGDALVVDELQGVAGRLEADLAAHLLDRAVIVSHIWPGPKRGYWNSSIRDLILLPRLPKKAALAALEKQRPLMRWAAHSARSSVDLTPQTFSV